MESTTVKEAIEFYNTAVSYIEKNPKERSTLTYGLNKLIMFYRKRVDKGGDIHTEWQNEVNEAIEDIRVKFCEKDTNGVLQEKIYGGGATLVTKKVFTPSQEKACNKEIVNTAKDIEIKWDGKPIELKKHIVPLPPSLDISWIEAFSGFVIDPLTDEEMEKHYIAQAEKKE